MNSLRAIGKATDFSARGTKMHRLMDRLYPICRSITGNGVRQTLRILGEQVPIEVIDVPTGTKVLDWQVPLEWNIRDAYIADVSGRRIIDFKDHNLHIVSYSVPVNVRIGLTDLLTKLHTLPAQPDLIPYRTSYYKRDWGFCLSQKALNQLRDDEYHVVIDSTLSPGSLTYGELLIPGQSRDEILLSAHCCHPSMCNDNLSGIVLLVDLAELLTDADTYYTYRILLAPGTIGAITWLAHNGDAIARIRHGLVAACVGDSGPFTYKRSRRETADIDRAAAIALRDAGSNHEVRPFVPYGYDERQFCSPGFDLPIGSLSRTPHGEFCEYHTSADDLDLVKPRHLGESLSMYLSVLSILEEDQTFENVFPFGEPQLGRRGLYSEVGGRANASDLEYSILWLLNQSDGTKSLLDIAERSGIGFFSLSDAAELLESRGLLRQVETNVRL